MILSIACYSIPNPTTDFCKAAIQSAFLLNIVAISVIQGILVTRVWYLFQGGKIVQVGIIVGFIISLVLSLVFLYLSANPMKIIQPDALARIFPGYRNVGCKAIRPHAFWRIWLPSLVLHSILYILTGVRALRNRRLLKDAPILKRLLRDGGFFYFVVFVSVTLTAIGSFLVQYPTINIPSIYSHFLLTTISVAVSRVMLSIHSLAHKLGSDSAWLLSNVELSRVGWKIGAHEGELIIESHTVYAEDDFESDSRSISKSSLLKETRVGVYDGKSW